MRLITRTQKYKNTKFGDVDAVGFEFLSQRRLLSLHEISLGIDQLRAEGREKSDDEKFLDGVYVRMPPQPFAIRSLFREVGRQT
jgi:hypothetical protein